MVKRYTAVFAFVLSLMFVAALAVSSLAVAEEIPEIYVPDKSYFKMELDLPSKVDSGDEFAGCLYVKKVYSAFAKEGITSISGKFSYNRALFTIIPSSYGKNDFSVDITAYGFRIEFDAPVSYDKLIEYDFSIPIRARSVSNKDNESIDRTYICADYVMAEGDKAYSGIGGIGYTEFMHADGNFTDNPDYASSSAGKRFSAFLSEYNLSEDGKYITGFKPHTSGNKLIRKYPEITVMHCNVSAVKNGYISTEDVLMFFDGSGNVYKRLVCVIKGDLGGDGMLHADDYISLRLHIVKRKELSAAEKIAADVNGDGKIDSLDYILLRMHLLKIVDIFA